MSVLRTWLVLALIVASSMVAVSSVDAGAADWKPGHGPLMTRWAKDVSPDKVHPEYPRPQMVRPDWQNLNGLWQYAIRPKAEEQPKQFDGEILVPFPVESALSGVMKRVDETNRLWYRRSFKPAGDWAGKRLLLHFGAVDWESTVWVNGKQIGAHKGGYDPFSFDITDALKPAGDQEIVVAVFDPSDASFQSHGKQVKKPGGIMYTPTTGIWQTVWLEPVSPAHIASMKIVPDVDKGVVRITLSATGLTAKHTVDVTVLDAPNEQTAVKSLQPVKAITQVRAQKPGEPIELAIKDAKLWSPDSPFLYGLKITLSDGDKIVDAVDSYFGMRKISLGKTDKGITKLFLNNKPLFMLGPLDQGFWPDGLYTAPTDEALRYDIEMTKELGFNMARKHVKVEPQRWYYWCDKLGLLVWQDMPSGDRSIGANDPDLKRSPESAQAFEQELRSMIDTHYNSPSIVMWVPFNEGWGQYDTARIVGLVKQYDPTRLADCASGWTDRPVGDVHDIHVYPGPGSPQPESNRAAVLGEFGGLGLPIEGHTWQAKDNWGYVSYKNPQELTAAYVALLDNLHPLVANPGLSAAVYTQTTDVEVEVNGLMTYDREVIKPDAKRIAEVNRQVHLPPPTINVVVPTSQQAAQEWRYTLEKPADGWQGAGFDDASWKKAPGGFGNKTTPGSVVRTEWLTLDIWIRRTIELPEGKLANPALLIHHDEDAEVYVNGTLAANLPRYTTGYITASLSDEARATLKPGKNVIAVHCKQTGGGQYIDLGIVDRVPAAVASAAGDAKPRELFDGKTLTGWKKTVFGGEGEVAIEDGQLLIKYGSPLTGVTYTGEIPKIDYEIELDAMRVDGSDFFCGLTFPVGDDPCSFIVGGWGGGVTGISSLNGHDASENETTKYVEYKKGQWYHVRVRVTRAKIEAWIDKKQMVDVETTGKKISIRSSVEPSRPLGIASYATTAALKNIRLRAVEGDEER